MNKYKVSVIVLNLIVLSSLSYADNNLTNDKEKKLEQLLSIKDKVSISLPRSEQVKSSSNARTITLEEIKKRLEEVERNNIKEKIAIENFEKKVEAYKKKIYKLYD